MAEIVLAGADLVLPDRVLTGGTLIVDAGRIVDVRAGSSQAAPALGAALHGHVIVPGFVDAHVHGVDGIDTLGQGEAIRRLAAKLPRYGVTAFSPTTVACSGESLGNVLRQVRSARETPEAGAARVLPAHVEGPFLNPEYRGAQDLAWLRNPREALDGFRRSAGESDAAESTLRVFDQFAPDVGVVTMAPELEGGLELIGWLTTRAIRASIGHSGASFDEALAAIAAGATRATHLFNCMPRFHHRTPGLTGAVLQSLELDAEVIVDGVHVHPSAVRMALASKGPTHLLAITDGTALSGDASGPGELGGRAIAEDGGAARLADGTLAGSVATMDRVFRNLVGSVGVSLVDAAAMCATTPSRALDVTRGGVLVRDAPADFVVLDRHLEVVQTYVGGRLAYARGASAA